METIQNIKTRRSIRIFSDQVVSDDVIRQIVEAASFAPSWKNAQITRYHLIRKEEVIAKIAEEATHGFAWNEKIMTGTKSLMIVSYVKGRSGFEKDGSYSTAKGPEWQMFDAGVAAQTFCLAAHDLGVGSVILGIFNEEKIAELIDLPATETVAAVLAIGYPAEEPNAPKRKAVDELLSVIE